MLPEGEIPGNVPLHLDSEPAREGIAFNIGYYMVYFIVFSIAFAILRALFGRIYQRLNDSEKPVDWGKRFRRATNEDEAPK